MINRSIVLMLGVLLAACNGDDGSPTVRLEVGAAPAVTAPVENAAALTPYTPEVEAKIAAIREVLARDSLNRLVRLAESEDSFVSNFAGESHKVHWDLLRRTGFDPLGKLGGLLDGPYGTRRVGEQTWYIWPDFAALGPDELLPERLDFADRARLQALIGDTGLERVRDGQGYPGVRTAIAEDGDWLYFVHETEQEAEESE